MKIFVIFLIGTFGERENENNDVIDGLTHPLMEYFNQWKAKHGKDAVF